MLYWYGFLPIFRKFDIFSKLRPIPIANLIFSSWKLFYGFSLSSDVHLGIEELIDSCLPSLTLSSPLIPPLTLTLPSLPLPQLFFLTLLSSFLSFLLLPSPPFFSSTLPLLSYLHLHIQFMYRQLVAVIKSIHSLWTPLNLWKILQQLSSPHKGTTFNGQALNRDTLFSSFQKTWINRWVDKPGCAQQPDYAYQTYQKYTGSPWVRDTPL